MLFKTGLIIAVTASMQYESSLKNETAKFQALHENFCKEKASSLQALKGILPVTLSSGGLISFMSVILLGLMILLTVSEN